MFKKQFRALLIAMAALIILSGTASAYSGQATRVLLADGNKQVASVVTKAETVEEFLEENEIVIGEFDKLELPLDTPIEKQMRISIDRAFAVQVKVDGAEAVEVMTRKMPLYEFVTDYAKRTGQMYAYDKTQWHREVEPGQMIELTLKKLETLEVREVIPFNVARVETAALLIGEEKVAEQGQDGVKLFIYELEKVNDVETSRTLVQEKIERSPITEVVLVGTGVPAPVAAPVAVEAPTGDALVWPMAYSKVLTMNASAYTADYASTGKNPGDKYFGICATGMKAQYGVVAVDPKVIPLHTKLYIEGYGFAIAGDTGGAIKGNKIDLFFNTRSEALQFGRRDKVVYILADQSVDLGFDPFK